MKDDNLPKDKPEKDVEKNQPLDETDDLSIDDESADLDVPEKTGEDKLPWKNEVVEEDDETPPQKTFTRNEGPKINFDYNPPKESEEDETFINPPVRSESHTPDTEGDEEESVEGPEESNQEGQESQERQSSQHKPISERLDEEEDFDIKHVRSPFHEETPENQDSKYNFRGDRNKLFPYETQPQKKSGNKLIFVILVILILAGIAGGGYYFFFRNSNPQDLSLLPSSSPTEKATSSPTPTPVLVNRADITVRVLNGTETSGLASSASAQLKSLGYKTEPVGNATNSAFVRTVVRVKKNSPAGLPDQIIKDLMPQFDATSSTDLKQSDSADAEVILGSK